MISKIYHRHIQELNLDIKKKAIKLMNKLIKIHIILMNKVNCILIT